MLLANDLIKLTNKKVKVNEDVSVAPIVVSTPLNNRIMLSVSEDFDLYDRANAFIKTSDRKLTKSTKKKALEMALKEFSNTVYEFTPREQTWGMPSKLAYFEGELVDCTYGVINRYLSKIDNSVCYIFDNDTRNYYMVVDELDRYGYVALNLTNGTMELSTFKGMNYIPLTDKDVVFANQQTYSLIKKNKLLTRNIRIKSERYERVQKHSNEAVIYDRQSGIFFEQNEFLAGATNKITVNKWYLETQFNAIVNELKAQIGNNVLGCVKIEDKCQTSYGNVTGDRFSVDTCGLIIDFKKGTIDAGLKTRQRVLTSINSEYLECENNTYSYLALGNKIMPIYMKLGVLGYDKIIFENSNTSEIIAKDNELVVKLQINREWVVNYNRYPTTKKCDFDELVDRWR